MTKEITLKLTIDEVNLVLEAMGHMPYQHVYGLINKIQQQAGSQVQAEEE